MKNIEITNLLKSDNKALSDKVFTISGNVIIGGEGPFDIEGDVVVGTTSTLHYMNPMWEGDFRVSGSVIETQQE